MPVVPAASPLTACCERACAWFRIDGADHGILHVPSAELATTAFGLAAQPNIGGVMVVHAPFGRDDEATIESLCHPPKDLRAPVLVCAMGETTGAVHRTLLGRAGMPVFATPDQAAKGFRGPGQRPSQP